MNQYEIYLAEEHRKRMEEIAEQERELSTIRKESGEKCGLIQRSHNRGRQAQ